MIRHWLDVITAEVARQPPDLVAPRLTDSRPDDPRPRLIGALAMASVLIALDDWLEFGGSLPARVRDALAALHVG